MKKVKNLFSKENIVEVDVRFKDEEDSSKKTRIYISVNDETILDNLKNRCVRPYNEYKKIMPEIIDAINESILKNDEISDIYCINKEEVKVRWSQYAGCSCPCSPGFIIEGHLRLNIWVTLDNGNKESHVIEDKKRKFDNSSVDEKNVVEIDRVSANIESR